MERDWAVVCDRIAAFDVPAHAIADYVFVAEGVEIAIRWVVEERVVERVVENAIGETREAGDDCGG